MDHGRIVAEGEPGGLVREHVGREVARAEARPRGAIPTRCWRRSTERARRARAARRRPDAVRRRRRGAPAIPRPRALPDRVGAWCAGRRSRTSSCDSPGRTPEASSDGHVATSPATPGLGRGLGARRPDPVAAPRRAIWRRNARVFSKLWKGALLPTFLDPFFYLLALGFGLGTYIATGSTGSPTRSSSRRGSSPRRRCGRRRSRRTYNVYLRMNELRLYDNVLSTPVEPQDLVAGDMAWSASRATIYGTSFLIVVVCGRPRCPRRGRS